VRGLRLLIGLTVAGALVAPATVASGQERESGLGIRLAEAPTSSRDDPRAQSAVVDHVEAGTSFTRRLDIRNGTRNPLTPDVYVAAARITDGQFVIEERSDENEITAWATLAPDAIDLAPGQIGTVVLRVEVPGDAADGEYYGAALVAVEGGDPDGVQLASRVGIRIYLSVGDVPPPSDFEVERLSASRLADGRPVVTAEVRNTGGRALDMSGDLLLSDGPAGLNAGPFPAELGRTLAIGSSQPVRVVLDPETPAGPWQARLTLRSGRIEKAVTGTITFPDVGEQPEDVAFERADERKGPAALVASLLLLLVLLGLLWWLWRRRRRARERETESTEHG
jgi:hypothetical protein